MAKTKKLSYFNFKEVYVVCGDEDRNDALLFVTDSFKNLKYFLDTLLPDIDCDTRVLHGILTPAEFLPDSFKGKSVFVICQNPEHLNKGNVVDAGSVTPQNLAESVTNLLNEDDAIIESSPVTIDDIYILYGYQLQVKLYVDSEDTDEEVIEVCNDIGKKVKKISETVFK